MKPALAAFALCASSFVVCNTASAAESAEAFVAGDYAAARAAGRAEATAEGLSVACRAGLVLGSWIETGAARVATLHGAIDDCATAIRDGGAGVDAYVNYAIGLAFEAKRVHSPGLAGDTRKLLEAAVARFPDSGFAHGALGGWHAQVAAQGFLARTALGASRDEARKNFDIALKLDPDNVPLRYEYLRFLALGGRAERTDGARVAADIAARKPQDAFGKLVQEKAARLGAALASREKSDKAVEAALRATESFAGFEGEAADARYAAPFSMFPAAAGGAASQ